MGEEWLSSLGASLLFLGLGLLAAVASYNFYEARKAGLPLRFPRLWPARETDPEHDDDSATGAQDRWPQQEAPASFAASDAAGEPTLDDDQDPPEPAADPADDAAYPGSWGGVSDEPLDPRYEMILQFTGEAPLSDDLRLTLQRFTHIQTKPVRAYSEPHKGIVQLGMALATRSGFASLIEIEAFLEQAEQRLAAHGLKRLGPRPDAAASMTQARQVDALLSQLDGQICFHLKASRMPAWADVDRVMQELGLVVRGNGQYSRQGSDGRHWYSIMPADQGLFLSFLLDLPRVVTPAPVLGRMVEEAQAVGQAFEAELVDDRGMPLSAPAIAMMQSQVIARADQLRAAGLVPGAPLTCRLFP
ncbi:MAG: hypothetical protein FJY35_07900 [Betaproteobacteria bacterium]|nr:hypothetical protein [Betaproteobacteria bacterium]